MSEGVDEKEKKKPVISGISPSEGIPGTQVTIRGENLGQDANDIVMLYICGTDCLHTAKWKSSSKIIARVGQANRGPGDIRIMTRSGGRGICNVKFRVFIAQIGMLEESGVWVDESRSVPGREAALNVVSTAEEKDPLGLSPRKKMDPALLARESSEGSANLRMESFNPQCYLLENHYHTTLEELREGIKNLELSRSNEQRKNEEMHKTHLFPLINCVSTLAKLYTQLEQNKGDLTVTKVIANKICNAREKAESVFRDVLARKDAADATRNALSVLTRFKFIFFLSKSIDDNMEKKEYAAVINDYTRAKSLFGASDVGLFKEVMAQVEQKIIEFKALLNTTLQNSTSFEEQSRLIKYLKILEPQSDPAWDCILSYHKYLEDSMWSMEKKYCAIAKSETTRTKDGRLEESNAMRHFISDLVEFVPSKLLVFTKLTNTYNIHDEKYEGKLEDSAQMITNTVNVASWLVLNALAPKLLPAHIRHRYPENLLEWPILLAETHRAVLSYSLKSLRALMVSLLEIQLSAANLHPLMELCSAIRLEAIDLLVENTVDMIANLGQKETWEQQYLEKGLKTALTDLYETQVTECIASMRDILSCYPGEMDLFSSERHKEVLLEKAVTLVCSFKRTLEKILSFKTKGEGSSKKASQATTTVNVLTSICNLEFVIHKSLRRISVRLKEGSFRFSDVIFERSREMLLAFREHLVSMYTMYRANVISNFVSGATYTTLPEDDVSDWVKNILMGFVVTQAELIVSAPQLQTECLRECAASVIPSVLQQLSSHRPSGRDACCQCVIDLSALEGCLQRLLTLDSQTRLNAYRADLVGYVDQRKLQRSVTNLRNWMRLAVGSLESVKCSEIDENESNV